MVLFLLLLCNSDAPQLGEKPDADPSTLSFSLIGDIKSSSPFETPLMEKRELKEAHCPILKQTSTSTTVLANPSVQAPPAAEERRVAFDIGDSDVENKERKVAFDFGDSDEADCGVTNGGEWMEPRGSPTRYSPTHSTSPFSCSPQTGAAQQRLHWCLHSSPVQQPGPVQQQTSTGTK